MAVAVQTRQRARRLLGMHDRHRAGLRGRPGILGAAGGPGDRPVAARVWPMIPVRTGCRPTVRQARSHRAGSVRRVREDLVPLELSSLNDQSINVAGRRSSRADSWSLPSQDPFFGVVGPGCRGQQRHDYEIRTPNRPAGARRRQRKAESFPSRRADSNTARAPADRSGCGTSALDSRGASQLIALDNTVTICSLRSLRYSTVGPGGTSSANATALPGPAASWLSCRHASRTPRPRPHLP